MDMIVPITITSGVLTASNLPETDHAEWSSGTTYALAARVIVAADHKVYESAQASNTNHSPTTDDGTWWIEIGATNRWKPFDGYIADPAQGIGLIDYTLAPPSQATAIALFGLSANTATLTIENGADSYTETRDLINTDDVVDWYSFFFAGVDLEAEAVFLDLPYFGSGTTVQIEIASDPAESVSVGQIVVGDLFHLGETRWGSEIGILDASLKTRDEYNRAVILERDAAETARIPVFTAHGNVRRVRRKLKENRARPIVWIGDDDPQFGLIIYGFFADYRQTLTLSDHTEIMLYIEGLP